MFQTNETHHRSPRVEYLALDEIRCDGGTQSRAAINLQHVKLLEEQIEAGQQLEPVTVFYDGESYWLADGFHRWYAYRNFGEDVIACVIHQGSLRDAILCSVGANADNKPALPRSHQDKRRAVMMLLEDPEWSAWSDREIAKRCCVGNQMVSHLRKSICVNHTDTKLNKERKAQRGGKVYTVDTTNIGKKADMKSDGNALTGESGTIAQTSYNIEEQQEQSGFLEIAHHLKLVEAGLVEIHSPNNRKIDRRLARIAAVHDNTVEIWLRDVETMTMHKYTLKHQQVEPVAVDTEPQLVEVESRVAKLRRCNLDPFEIEILLLLERPVAFTPTELEYLTQMEHRHNRS